MERLTEKTVGGIVLSGDSLAAAGVALEKLAAYEDTGLEPTEIERILDAYGRGMTLRTENAERLRIIKDIPTDRLQELVRAETRLFPL